MTLMLKSFFVSLPHGPHYVLIEGLGYYKFHNGGKKWGDAKLTCEKEGTHLAIINSKEEVEVLKELRTRLPRLFGGDWRDDTIFIGITDIQVENSWKTIFGKHSNSVFVNETKPKSKQLTLSYIIHL